MEYSTAGSQGRLSAATPGAENGGARSEPFPKLHFHDVLDTEGRGCSNPTLVISDVRA